MHLLKSSVDQLPFSYQQVITSFIESYGSPEISSSKEAKKALLKSFSERYLMIKPFWDEWFRYVWNYCVKLMEVLDY